MTRFFALLLVVACQSGSGDKPAPVAPPIDAELEVVAPSGDDAASPEVSTDVGTPPEGVEPEDDNAVEDLGAIAAWQAVVDRDQYLARRGQHAVVYGHVGGEVPPVIVAGADGGVATPSGLIWLVDETEGNGALAIRVRFPLTPPATGDRVAVGGAWLLEGKRWIWEADAVTPLPPSDARPAVDPPVAPGLTVAVADPSGKRRLPDKVKEGELMEFNVSKRPPRDGDGWSISDRHWGSVLAYLILPGERASYGGHDLRSPDERWQLKVGATYWVRVGKIKKKGDDEPMVIRAMTAPVRFP